MDQQTIFTKALQQPTLAERTAYLDAVCAQDAALRRQMEAMLDAHERASGLLEADLLVELGADDELSPGVVIGNYRLVEEIGDGGFGVVFLADQLQPVSRRVAIKIVKLGMDTRQVVARFEAERQTLARMEHPNIAKVFDAGATETGRPYFVMEYVDGVPITCFCDEQHYTVRQRIELLTTVCRAIHHAHQKAIIHRDIKPSNVLVSMQEGQPVAKIIDFGIAKALESGRDESHQLTHEKQLLGTPSYMSPEQASGRHGDIDIRADVYSLGILAYELLTGAPPFVEQPDAGWRTQRKRVIDDEPNAPSQQAARVTDAAAKGRGTSPSQLRTVLRGDLDWIILKALAKDRGRRYQSALDLAEDIDRYLRDEPIEARPPSLSYRGSKFIRRRRTAIVLTLTPLLLLTTFGATHWATRLRFERQHEERIALSRRQIERELHQAYRWYDPLRKHGARDSSDIGKSLEAARRAEALLDSADADTIMTSRVRGLLARLQQEQGDLQFLDQMKHLRLDFPGTASSDRENSQATADLSHFAKAFQVLGIEPLVETPQDAAEMLQQRPAEVQQMAVAALDLWAISIDADASGPLRQWLQSVARIADPDSWRSRLREGIRNDDLESLVALAGTKDLERQPAPTLMVLATVLQQRKHPAALTVLRRAAEAHPDVFVFNAVMGNLYSRQGASLNDEAIRRAIRHFTAALAVRPDDVHILNSLAMNLSRSAEYDDAVSMLQRAVERTPDHWLSWHNLSLALCRQGDYAKALTAAQQSILRMHLAHNLQNLNPVMTQTLQRIELCVELESSQRLDDDPQWQLLAAPPDDWLKRSVEELPWSDGRMPVGTPLFRPTTNWHTPKILLHWSGSLPEGVASSDTKPRNLLFVISAAAQGQILVNRQPVAEFRDAGGDPHSYVVSVSSLPPMPTEQDAPLVVDIVGTKTKSEALLQVEVRLVDVEVVQRRLASVIRDLQDQLASPETNRSSGSEHQDARQKVRDAFDASARQLWHAPT